MVGLKGLLITLSVLGTMTAATIIVTPRIIRASGDAPPTDIIANEPVHQAVLDGLAAILERAHGVMAIHQRGASPYVEIVVWINDSDDPDIINAGEIAVISHSSIMRTLSFYEWIGDDDTPPTFETEQVREPEFCTQWRSRGDVKPRVIGSDVADMQAMWTDLPTTSTSPLQIGLSWSDDVFDDDDHAVMLIEARTP